MEHWNVRIWLVLQFVSSQEDGTEDRLWLPISLVAPAELQSKACLCLVFETPLLACHFRCCTSYNHHNQARQFF